MASIRHRGFEVYSLPAERRRVSDDTSGAEALHPHAMWLGADWATDAQQTREVLGNAAADWLIADHYAIDERWERELRPVYDRLMVIDDLADRVHECDLLLDQNLGRQPADYANLIPEHSRILAGQQYALLRPEFAVQRPYSLARRAIPDLKRLLVTLGGVDTGNATYQVLNALTQSPLPTDCHITAVIGSQSPSLDQVRALAARMPWTTEVLVDVSDMAKLMAESDLAIGAAGTTAWERCCLGLPTLTIVLADNQRRGAEALAACGAAFILGLDSLASELPEKLALLLSGNNLEQMQRVCLAVTDGNGTSQVVDELMNSHD